jgi:hypothetical protein
VGAYSQSGYPICLVGFDDVRDYRPRNDEDRNLTVSRLSAGWSVESHFVTDLQRTEVKIREGCVEFVALLDVMESYGGDEVVEI